MQKVTETGHVKTAQSGQSFRGENRNAEVIYKKRLHSFKEPLVTALSYLPVAVGNNNPISDSHPRIRQSFRLLRLFSC